MTKDLEQDLHNIFSAIFSGRKVNKEFVEDFRIVVNILNTYSQNVLTAKYIEETDDDFVNRFLTNKTN